MSSDYDRVAGEFAKTRTILWPEVASCIDAYVHRGDSVLDVGCGNGRLWSVLQTRDVEYVGVDQSARFIEMCREKYGTNGKSPYFERLSALELPLPDRAFDVVFLLAVLNHFPSFRDLVLLQLLFRLFF